MTFDPRDLARDDVRAVLAEGDDVKGLQILHAALTAGPLMFGLVVAGMAVTKPASSAPAPPLETLSLAHAAVAATTLVVAFVLPGRILGQAIRTASAPDAKSFVVSLLVPLRTAWILRLSLLEGPALFGLLICFLGAQSGVLEREPIHALNALSAAFLLAHNALAFPTAERIADRLLAGTRAAPTV